MKTPKLRADELVVKKGLVESRSKAQALIMAEEILLARTDASGGVVWEPV